MDHGGRKRILITGATGTLGYNVYRVLSGDPRYELYLPVRTLRPELFKPDGQVRVFLLDLADRTRVREVIEQTQPDAVVHCAASGLRPPKPAWFEMTSFNVEGTLRLFEACCALRRCHFIYISSGLVYREQGRPLSETGPLDTLHPYGASKSAADWLLRAAAVEFGRKLTLLRPFSFTGLNDGGERLFPSLLRAAAEGRPFPLSAGGQVRDFCSVTDIARGVALSIEPGHASLMEALNLGSGLAVTIRGTVERVCQELNLRVDLQFGARDYYPHEPMHLVADIAKAEAMLGWRPRENLAHAVWELAQSEFPALPVTRPAWRL